MKKVSQLRKLNLVFITRTEEKNMFIYVITSHNQYINIFLYFPPHSSMPTMSTSTLRGAGATGPWTCYAHYAHPSAAQCGTLSTDTTLCTASLSSRPTAWFSAG